MRNVINHPERDAADEEEKKKLQQLYIVECLIMSVIIQEARGVGGVIGNSYVLSYDYKAKEGRDINLYIEGGVGEGGAEGRRKFYKWDKGRLI